MGLHQLAVLCFTERGVWQGALSIFVCVCVCVQTIPVTGSYAKATPGLGVGIKEAGVLRETRCLRLVAAVYNLQFLRLTGIACS